MLMSPGCGSGSSSDGWWYFVVTLLLLLQQNPGVAVDRAKQRYIVFHSFTGTIAAASFKVIIRPSLGLLYLHIYQSTCKTSIKYTL